MSSPYTKQMEQIHALVRGEIAAQTLAAEIGVETQRLAVYPRFVRSHVFDMLEKHFGCLQGLLHDTVWADLSQAYFEQVPCQKYDLNLAAEQFPEFVLRDDVQQKYGLTAFHAELCQLEWEEYVVFKAKVHWPKHGDIDAPVLHPSLSIFEFCFPVGTFLLAWRRWEMGQSAGKPDVPKEAQERMLVLQHPQTRMSRLLVADDALLLAFKAVHAGLSLAAMCAATSLSEGEMIKLLHQAERKGLILLPKDWVSAARRIIDA